MGRGVLLLTMVLLLLPAGLAPTAARAADPAPRLQGGFAEFWRAHNGALLFGEPLTDEIVTPGLTVQYLERARLEWHPDYSPGRQITLGRLGGRAEHRPQAGDAGRAGRGRGGRGRAVRRGPRAGDRPVGSVAARTRG